MMFKKKKGNRKRIIVKKITSRIIQKDDKNVRTIIQGMQNSYDKGISGEFQLRD